MSEEGHFSPLVEGVKLLPNPLIFASYLLKLKKTADFHFLHIRVRKIYIFQLTKLLPLQGALLIAIIHRSMPWARNFGTFSP